MVTRSVLPRSIASSCARSTRQPPAGRSTATPPRARRRRRPGSSAARSLGYLAARPGQVDERAAELELSGQPAAALERQVELGKPNNCVLELVRREVRRLLEQLLDVETVLLQPLCRLAR